MSDEETRCCESWSLGMLRWLVCFVSHLIGSGKDQLAQSPHWMDGERTDVFIDCSWLRTNLTDFICKSAVWGSPNLTVALITWISSGPRGLNIQIAGGGRAPFWGRCKISSPLLSYIMIYFKSWRLTGSCIWHWKGKDNFVLATTEAHVHIIQSRHKQRYCLHRLALSC